MVVSKIATYPKVTPVIDPDAAACHGGHYYKRCKITQGRTSILNLLFPFTLIKHKLITKSFPKILSIFRREASLVWSTILVVIIVLMILFFWPMKTRKRQEVAQRAPGTATAAISSCLTASLSFLEYGSCVRIVRIGRIVGIVRNGRSNSKDSHEQPPPCRSCIHQIWVSFWGRVRIEICFCQIRHPSPILKGGKDSAWYPSKK